LLLSRVCPTPWGEGISNEGGCAWGGVFSFRKKKKEPQKKKNTAEEKGGGDKFALPDSKKKRMKAWVKNRSGPSTRERRVGT